MLAHSKERFQGSFSSLSFGFRVAYRYPFIFLTGPKTQVDLKDRQGALLLPVTPDTSHLPRKL